MKKFVSLCTLMALPLVGFGADYFVGVAGEAIKYEKKILLDTVIKNEEITGFGLKVKAGAVFDDIYRFSLQNSNFSKEEDKLNTTTLNYDYIAPINDKLGFFLGLHVGYGKFTNENFKADGLAYGFQGGFLYELLPNLELETGASYTLYEIEESYTKSFVKYDFDLKKSSAMNMGLNLKF